MPAIRCSSLPLISLCAPAAQAPRVAIELGDPEIPALGSAVHDCLALKIKGLNYDAGAIADQWQVELKGLLPLLGRALFTWEKASRYFPEPDTEIEMGYSDGELSLTGHGDVVSLTSNDEVRIADHKTGYLDTDATEQVKGYAFLAAKKFKRKIVRASVLRVRERTLQTATYHVDELDAWWTWLKAHVTKQVYHPGYESCGRCRRWHECDAGKRLTREAGAMLVDFSDDKAGVSVEEATEKQLDQIAAELILDITPGQAAEAIGRARLIDKASKFARALVKTYVKHTGSQLDPDEPGKITLPIPEGGTLEISTTKKREIAYTEESLRMITEVAGDECLTDICKISASKLDTAVKANAPRGHKQEAVQGLTDRLEAAGCLTFDVIERLDVKSAPKLTGVSS